VLQRDRWSTLTLVEHHMLDSCSFSKMFCNTSTMSDRHPRGGKWPFARAPSPFPDASNIVPTLFRRFLAGSSCARSAQSGLVRLPGDDEDASLLWDACVLWCSGLLKTSPVLWREAASSWHPHHRPSLPACSRSPPALFSSPVQVLAVSAPPSSTTFVVGRGNLQLGVNPSDQTANQVKNVGDW